MNRKILLDHYDEIVSLYLQKESTKAIAARFNVYPSTIQEVLRKRGVLKNISECQRRYPINDALFSRIDNEATAYWLGFLAADGYIYRNSLVLRIGEKDTSQLESFRDWIQPGKPLQRIASVYQTTTVGIDIKSSRLIEDLARYGIGTKKTYQFVKRPQMPDELVRHFYRGYVDGDGYLGISLNRCRFSLLGTEPLLVEFQEWLRRHIGMTVSQIRFQKGIWELQKCGNKCVPMIARYLYSDCHWSLERKQAIAIQMLKMM